MAFTFAFGAKIHWHLYIQSGFERKNAHAILLLQKQENAHAILLLLKGLQYLCCQIGSVPYVLWQMAIVHPQQVFLVFVQLHQKCSQ